MLLSEFSGLVVVEPLFAGRVRTVFGLRFWGIASAAPRTSGLSVLVRAEHNHITGIVNIA